MTGWTMGTEGWIVMVLWAVLMLVAIWLLVREPRQRATDDADTILRDRFARGELTEEEFRRATEALAADPAATTRPAARHHSPHPIKSGQEAHHDRP